MKMFRDTGECAEKPERFQCRAFAGWREVSSRMRLSLIMGHPERVNTRIATLPQTRKTDRSCGSVGGKYTFAGATEGEGRFEAEKGVLEVAEGEGCQQDAEDQHGQAPEGVARPGGEHDAGKVRAEKWERLLKGEEEDQWVDQIKALGDAAQPRDPTRDVAGWGSERGDEERAEEEKDGDAERADVANEIEPAVTHRIRGDVVHPEEAEDAEEREQAEGIELGAVLTTSGAAYGQLVSPSMRRDAPPFPESACPPRDRFRSRAPVLNGGLTRPAALSGTTNQARTREPGFRDY